MKRLMATGLALAALCSDAAAQTITTERYQLVVETVADGLDIPWGMAFLADGRALLSERDGRLRILDPGRPEGARLSAPLDGTPQVAAAGQGGLLDVAVDPDFAASRLVYLSFSEPREGGRNGTSVGRGKLSADERSIEGFTVIFRQLPAIASSAHFGSRLVFDTKGALFVSTGDRFVMRQEAQNPANHIGKIIRILPDGGIPDDNPKRDGWAPEVWSIGHRNAQGVTLDPATGELITVEHGARGGDEVNRPQSGRNYGWPVITYGRDYSGAKIGIGTAKAGMEQPVHYWDPSIAPSSVAVYAGEAFPAWRGNLLVGALAGERVARLELDADGRVVHEEAMLSALGARIRNVEVGPDGFVYLFDETAGRVLRLKPKG